MWSKLLLIAPMVLDLINNIVKAVTKKKSERIEERKRKVLDKINKDIDNASNRDP